MREGVVFTSVNVGKKREQFMISPPLSGCPLCCCQTFSPAHFLSPAWTVGVVTAKQWPFSQSSP